MGASGPTPAQAQTPRAGCPGPQAAFEDLQGDLCFLVLCHGFLYLLDLIYVLVPF